MESGKRQAVATIVLEGERLLNLARASGNGAIADLIQAMIDEARATLDGRPAEADGGPQTDAASVVRLRTRDKPRRLH
jgi:hypothetical protein